MSRALQFSMILLSTCVIARGAPSAQTLPADPRPAPGGAPNIFYGAIAHDANTAPVVVFAPGLGTNAYFWWQHGNTMYQKAYAAGYRTAFVSFDAANSNNTATIAQNGVAFEKLLPQILSYFNTTQAWVVAHSKGGLDVQYAMLDTPTRLKIKGLFTLATPNQGSALADWGAGAGAPILQSLGIYTPGLLDLQTVNVQSLRKQLDPILRNAGIPVFALAGKDYLKLKDPVYAVTGPILQNLTGEANDGLVAPSETKLDEMYGYNMGELREDHTQMGLGDTVFSFPRGRIDGFEYAVSGFKQVNMGGFGDRFNTWIWSLRWFKGKLYAGTGRQIDCVTYATAALQPGVQFLYPPPSLPCTPDPKNLPLRAEIWRYTPETLTWERVFQSPNDIPLGNDAAGNPVSTSRQLGFRDLYVFTESDGTQALYAASVTGNCMFGLLPQFAPSNYPPPQILRSTDGVHWAPIPQDPGTFLGDLVKNNTDITVVGLRSFQAYKGMLFATVCNLRGEGFIIASSNPAAGNNAWQRVSPTPESTMPVWDLQVFNNYLYAAGGDRTGTAGYFVWKTDATGPAPYNFQVVIANGAWQPAVQLRSPAALSLAVHNNMLYVGTDRKVEMIRIHPDDSWDLVIGAQRTAPDGKVHAPISGIGTYLDNTFTGHFWQLGESNKGLNLTTWDWSTLLRPLGPLATIFNFQYGFDFMRSEDAVNWTAISRTGLLDGENYGGRSMEMTPFGWFLGTTRLQGGGQVIVDQSVLDFNNDRIIDQNDVNIISAAIGQPAGQNDVRDLDRDGRISAHDAQLLSSQCTFPECSGLPPAVMSRLTAPALAAPVVTAAAKSRVGNQAYLTWQPVPGAVRYRVYRITNRPLTDFLHSGGLVPIPGTTLQAIFPTDFLSGKFNFLCQGELSEEAPCAFVDTVTASVATNNQVGWPTATEQIAVIRDSPFQEAAPAPMQSLYFVRAEDVNGNLSEVSNTVGAPSKVLPQ